MNDRRIIEGGAGSFVAVVISLLISFVLIVLYLRTFMPRGPAGGPEGSAVEAARNQAKAFEEQQKKRLEQMQELSH